MTLNKHLKQQGDLKDRGRTKWTAMMLPEHIRELREWYAEDEKTPQPLLDELDLQLIGDEIERGYSSGEEVRIKTWKYGYEKQYRGIIVNLNPHYLVYEDPFGDHVIYLRDIIGVDILN